MASSEFSFRTPVPSTSLSASAMTKTQSSRLSGLLALLAKVKVASADIGPNDKPCNLHLHNMHVYINIQNEEDACISYIQEKVREEMNDHTLCIVGTSGLLYHDNEGTKGNYIYFESLN